MEYIRFVARKRARFHAIGGHPVNIPYGTAVECRDGYLHFNGHRLCSTKSRLIREYFCQDDDGKGLERGALISAITAHLEQNPSNSPPDYQKRWDRVWADPLYRRYRRTEHEDHWLWNHDFFNAPVEDLRQIAALIGAKVK